MRTREPLTWLCEQVSDFFAANASAPVVGAGTVTGGGTATLTPGGSPASDYDVRVRFGLGGTVGTSGITYQESLDGGRNYGPVEELGVATAIDVASTLTGVTVALGSGTILANQVLAFTTEGPRMTARVLFGWKEYYAQINQGADGGNRIVFVPGNALQDGADGPFSGVKSVGDFDITPPPAVGEDAPAGIRARRLFDVNCNAMISIWGVDPARPQDDAASYEAVARLREDLVRAIWRKAAGLVKFSGQPKWNGTKEQQFGREQILPMFVLGTIFDLPVGTVSPAPTVNHPTQEA